MRKAVIENGIVTNIIEASASYAPDGVILVDATGAGIGGGWDGAVFTPAPPIPIEEERERMVVSVAQLRIALEEAGQLANVQTKIAAFPRAVAALQFAGAISRNSQLVATIISEGAATDTGVDNIFRAAMAVEI